MQCYFHCPPQGFALDVCLPWDLHISDVLSSVFQQLWVCVVPIIWHICAVQQLWFIDLTLLFNSIVLYVFQCFCNQSRQLWIIFDNVKCFVSFKVILDLYQHYTTLHVISEYHGFVASSVRR